MPYARSCEDGVVVSRDENEAQKNVMNPLVSGYSSKSLALPSEPLHMLFPGFDPPVPPGLHVAGRFHHSGFSSALTSSWEPFLILLFHMTCPFTLSHDFDFLKMISLFENGLI